MAQRSPTRSEQPPPLPSRRGSAHPADATNGNGAANGNGATNGNGASNGNGATNGNGAGAAGSPARDAERLFEEHSGRIYRFCLRRLNSPQEAEDALQATYLNAWRSLKGGTRPNDATAWLFGIAANVCTSALRSGSHRRAGELRPPGDFDDVPSERVESEELLGLSEALEALPERQRQALLLRDWRGLSYDEIAGALGASHPAVETLLFRARRAVAASLTKPVARARRIPVRSALSALLPWPSAFSSAKAALTGGTGATKAAIAIGVGATAPLLAFGLVERSLDGRDSPASVRSAAPAAVQPDPWLRTAATAGRPADVEAPRAAAAVNVKPSTPKAAEEARKPGASRDEAPPSGDAAAGVAPAAAAGSAAGDRTPPSGKPTGQDDAAPTEPAPSDPAPPEPGPSGPPPGGDAGKEPQASGKVTLCHATGSKKKPGVTISVAAAAVDAHVGHGDQLGSCPS